MKPVGSRMIVHQEAVAPWILASLVAMAAYLASTRLRTPELLYQRIVVTIALCSGVVATEFVLIRSRRVDEEVSRDHRARPAGDELTPATSDPYPQDRGAGSLPPYAAGQLDYSR